MLAEDQNAPSANAGEDDGANIEGRNKQILKSYDNKAWLHSRGAREIRILCEYLEVRDRLRAHGVLTTFVLFGSARAQSRATWEANMLAAKAKLSAAGSDPETQIVAQERVAQLKRLEWACDTWEKIRQLAEKLMQWVQTPEAHKAIEEIMKEIPMAVVSDSPHAHDMALKYMHSGRYCASAMCTGGGPGMMEAANCGAAGVKGSCNIGLGITVPFERGVNDYVTPDLAFEFHYFFTRKFWMTYPAIGVIAAPGGVGTLDELMEFLTLKQSYKLKRDVPVVLFGETFWKKTVNFDHLVETGMVDARDRDQIFFTDSVEDAFNYFREHILAGKLLLGNSHVHKSMRPPPSHQHQLV